MENLEIITSIIGSVGFPIVCCIFLWKFINGALKDFTSAVNENSEILNRLYNKLGELHNDKTI